jgi:PleD family two-component response regulator
MHVSAGDNNVAGRERTLNSLVKQHMSSKPEINQVTESVVDQPSKILVVDDEVIIQTLLYEVLTEEGYEVTTANNGKEGIDLLEKSKFDLVITDIVMPVLNGIEVLLAAKRIDMAYPVIVITGYHSVDSVVRLVNLGAADYIAKPFKIDLIRMTVAKVLQMRHIKTISQKDSPKENTPAVDGGPDTYNFAMFSNLLNSEVGRSLRLGRGFGLLVVEINRVSGAGSGLGTVLGDDYAGTFATILKGETSPADDIARSDQGEFAIILPETSRDDVDALAQRITRKAEWTFSVSTGSAMFPDDSTEGAALIGAARYALKTTRAHM